MHMVNVDGKEQLDDHLSVEFTQSDGLALIGLMGFALDAHSS